MKKKMLLITACSSLLVVLFLSFSSCKSAKKIQLAINKKDTIITQIISSPGVDSAAMVADILKKVNANHIDFETFISKVKVDYTDQSGKNSNANANIRIAKDSIIWVQLTGLLDIEGFRILIKPDTVWVMDKQEKTISQRSISYIQEVTNLPVDFTILQDLILGNPVFFNDNIMSFRYDGNTLSALSVGTFFKHFLSLDTTKNEIFNSKLDDVDPIRNRTCRINLSNYEMVNGKSFSTKRDITISEKNQLSVHLEFKQIAFNEPVTFPFSVPKRFKVK